MPEAEGQEKKTENTAQAGFMVGARGWIILIGAVVIEALFFMGMMMFHNRDVAKTPTEDTTAKPTADDIRPVIVLKDLNYTIPTATSQVKTLSTEINIVLERTPEEIQQNVAITQMDWDKYTGAVKKMEPAIRDQLMSYITKQSFSQLNSERGKQMLKDFLKDYINEELAKIDLKLDNKDLPNKRVGKIYIVNFIMQ